MQKKAIIAMSGGVDLSAASQATVPAALPLIQRMREM